MKFDPKKHHRRSIRLKGYDYAQPGAYFVTLVAWHREALFGKVVGGSVRLSALGRIVEEEWLRSIEIRREIRLYQDEFVVMPNHLHGIVWIVEVDGVDVDRKGAWHAPGDIEPWDIEPGDIEPGDIAPGDIAPGDIEPWDVGARRAPQPGSQPAPQPGFQPALYRAPRSLSSFIAGFKASVTSRANRELDMTGIWQRNYYERIIRNETELKNIWNYIDMNSERWYEDQMHPNTPPNPFTQDKQHD
jgi:putative transposase